MAIYTGRCGHADFNQFREIIEEQNKESRQHYNSRPSESYRRPGDAVSGGDVAVKAARKLRKDGKVADNAFLRAGMSVPTYGDTLRLPPGGVDAVTMGLCRGEVHGDLVCGRVLEDQKYCAWCFEYENVVRYLCLQRRRTDSAPGEAHCREPCPAKQRLEGGRPARSQHFQRLDGAGWSSATRKWNNDTGMLAVQRQVKARFGSILAQEGQQRVDQATVLAAVGRLRSGGTAAADSSPPQTQMARALRKFQVERRAS